MKLLLRLYPASWRRRYGEEFAALLEDRRLGPRQVLDVVRGALDARLHARVVDRYSMQERSMAMVFGRDELRDELRAILAARDELGAEHEQYLVEGLLDRLEGGEMLPVSHPGGRRDRLRRVFLMACVATTGGGVVALHAYGLPGTSVQAQRLPDIAIIDAQVPAYFMSLPLNNYTNRNSPRVWGDALVGDGGQYPYAFRTFYLRYRNCPNTPRGSFRLTAYIRGYRVTGHSNDGRLFIQRTGLLTRWTHTAVYYDRTFAGTLMFPTPHKGLYYWKVEVPSVQGCTWRIDYNGS